MDALTVPTVATCQISHSHETETLYSSAGISLSTHPTSQLPTLIYKESLAAHIMDRDISRD